MSEQGFVGLLKGIRARNSQTDTIVQEAQVGQRTVGTGKKKKKDEIFCKLNSSCKKDL